MTGTLPRRGTAAPGRAGAPAWTEATIARLAEDAARRAPAASRPVATVRVDGTAARVDLDLVVDHGAHLPTVGEAVRRRVAAGIEAQTGLTVEAVTVTVVDLRLPAANAGPHDGPSGDGRARWPDRHGPGRVDVHRRPAAGG
ncbi:Asp23/Gls24 family envelope stress response protein [Micromonospora soli]|uniref:Asp23/Gls24 family envelope stress response protein n=1 Tax=Micromonospora sp. NBRC 110009 TaxID=3061627 RepID=UPI0026714A47|nr:Asp23/Gls24 family envelope stress response protein [Micromonospora sp. NBRC 110009]WKT98240.1 Asp23/Gls24 family envelope stress response protein [Micromonospora sp. NBRC 110009]